MSALNIAQSGLKAYGTALDHSAHNIANANTQGFQTQSVQFQEQAQGGVIVTLSPASQQLNASEERAEPAPSNTDLATELVQSLEYKAGFLLSAKLIQSSEERLGTLINLSE